jgi:peptide/nickel transport system substrate-binding protein
MNRREFLISASGLSLVAGLGVPSLPAQAAQDELVLVLGSSSNGCPNYDPIRGTYLNLGAYLIYDRLIEMDADQSYHPHLAQSWENSPDGMTWSFNLRQGVKFHDGEPFNAHTIPWWISKYTGTENQFMVDAIDHVEVVDDHAFRFIMKRPEPNLIYYLANVFMGIPSPKSYDAAGEGYGVTEAVGTGPFKLESFVISQETVLVSNEDYAWPNPLSENQGAANIKHLTLREIPDASTAFLELKTGGVGMLLGLPTEFLPQLQAEKSIKFRTLPGIGVTTIKFNVRKEPFTDIKVRQATALAVDQSAILKGVYNGIGTESHQFLIGSLAESRVGKEFEIHYDPEKANQLLDEAGWVRGADGIRQKAGAPLAVSLWTRGETEYKRIAEIVQAQLKAIGMTADIAVFDKASLDDQLKKGQHQLVINHYEWNNADELDWEFSAKRIPFPNVSMWDDPRSEQLNDIAMHKSKTWDERVANFRKLHEYLLSQFVFIPIHEPAQNIAYNSDILSVPEAIRGAEVMQQTVLDLKTLG